MNKKTLYILIACLVAVLLVCVVVVGMIDGVWPWNQGKDLADGYTGIHTKPSEATTQEETTLGENTATTGEETVETTKGGNTGSGSKNPTTTKPTTGSTNPTVTVKPTKPTEEEPTYGIVEDPDEDVTAASKASNEIDFDDLVEGAKKG